MGMAGSLGGALLMNPNLIGGTTAGVGGIQDLSSHFSTSSGGTALAGGLNLGNYTLGSGINNFSMSGGGYRF
jgi:hypothetical protein